MKKQLKLSDLKVNSFVTQLKSSNANTAKGGAWSFLQCSDTPTTSGYDGHDDGGGGSNTCYNTCNYTCNQTCANTCPVGC